jgi:pimeloyl-ACP methyl ester carboxylesterase
MCSSPVHLTAGRSSHSGVATLANPLTLAWLAPLVDTRRIYAPDIIGQPGKTVGQRVSANDSSLGDWTTDVLDVLELSSAAFIGASYGAGVLLRLAAVAPARIDRAVLVVPAGMTAVPVRSMLSLAAGYLGYRALRRPGIAPATVRQLAGPDPDPLMIESTALAFAGTELDTEMPRHATPEDWPVSRRRSWSSRPSATRCSRQVECSRAPRRCSPTSSPRKPSMDATTSSAPPVPRRSANAFGRSSRRTDGARGPTEGRSG